MCALWLHLSMLPLGGDKDWLTACVPFHVIIVMETGCGCDDHGYEINGLIKQWSFKSNLYLLCWP